jgi:hypothetical protein
MNINGHLITTASWVVRWGTRFLRGSCRKNYR